MQIKKRIEDGSNLARTGLNLIRQWLHCKLTRAQPCVSILLDWPYINWAQGTVKFFPCRFSPDYSGDLLLIQNYGLFWDEVDVFWGAGSKKGRMLGVPATNTTADAIDFREQSGVYVLYADYELVYVGQVGAGNQKLFTRLKQHTRDSLARRWNKFSWFGIRRVLRDGQLSVESDGKHSTHSAVLNHIEAILIHSAEPTQNRQGGRFGEDVVQFLQLRDDQLGPTQEEMVHALWLASRATV